MLLERATPACLNGGHSTTSEEPWPCLQAGRVAFVRSCGGHDQYTTILFCSIVNRGDWLWSPVNIKGANQDAKIYIQRSTTAHNLLFCAHAIALCTSYVIKTFLLARSSVSSKQLFCFVHGQGQKSEQKRTTISELCRVSQLFPSINYV